MNLMHDTDQPALEEGVRAMLRHIAADVQENPPSWDELISRPASATVTALPTTRTRTDLDNSRAPWHRPRLSLAAAGVVALAIAGALLVDRPGTGGDGNTLAPATDVITAISPSEAAFDAEAAAAVWTTDLDDPVTAAAAYLETTGITTDASISNAATLDLRADDGATATVDWSVPDGTALTGGTVYLRAAGAQAAVQGWSVVGAAAADVSLEGVRFDGEDLSFTVARAGAEGEQLALGVWIDGLPRSLGGEAVAQAGAAGVSLGELVEIGAGAGAEQTVTLPVESDDTVTLRVAHVVDGYVRSVTQMVVALPEADPSGTAGATAHADVDADAGASVDSVPGDASPSAGTQDGDTPTDGIAVPLPDGTDLTVPPIPGLPTLPPLPLPPVPATLPAPPSGLVP